MSTGAPLPHRGFTSIGSPRLVLCVPSTRSSAAGCAGIGSPLRQRGQPLGQVAGPLEHLGVVGLDRLLQLVDGMAPAAGVSDHGRLHRQVQELALSISSGVSTRSLKSMSTWMRSMRATFSMQRLVEPGFSGLMQA